MDRLEELSNTLLSINLRLAILDKVVKEVRAETPSIPGRLELLDKNVIPQIRGLNEDRAVVLKEIREILGEPEPEPLVINLKMGSTKARSRGPDG